MSDSKKSAIIAVLPEDRSEEIKRLDEDVANYMEVLRKLFPAEGEAEDGPVQKKDMARCHGLLFTTAYKGGIGFGFEYGYGFVIAKLPSKDGNPTWSSPMFVRVHAGSLGATLGFSKIDSIVILETAQAVEAFRKEVMQLQTNIAGPVGVAIGADQSTSAKNLEEGAIIGNYLQEGSLAEKSFSLAAGAMVDLSLRSLNYNVDIERNVAFYGETATPASIMNGDYPIPTQSLNELYRMINSAIKHSSS